MARRASIRTATERSPEERLVSYDPRARRLLLIAVGCGLGAAVAVLAAALLFSAIVARIHPGPGSLADVAPLLGLLVVLAGARAAFIGLQEVVGQRAASVAKGSLRRDVTGHLLELGPAYAREQRSGDIATTLTRGFDDLDAYLTSYRPARLLAVIVPVAVIVVALVIDPPTAVVLLLTGPVLVLLLAVIGSRAHSLTQRRFAEMRWLSAFFLDKLQGIATLKAFGRSAEQVGNIESISRRYGTTTMEVLRSAFQTALVLEWGAAVATAVVAVEVSLRLMAGGLPFERALALLLITPEFFLPLRQLALRYHAGSAGRAAAERIFVILDAPRVAAPHAVRAAAASIESAHVAPSAEGDIRFENVSFAYRGRDWALRAFDLEIRAGEVVALIGETGAGKSTAAALLLGFIEPVVGRITVAGLPIAGVDRSAWLESVASVPQAPHLFHGTVAENIRLSRRAASDADVRAAADAAEASEFIARLPDGFATAVGENGVRLSGGERQRIALARAFLKDAPYLVLDEPTSQLDPVTEAAIRRAIERLVGGRTVLLISHRHDFAALADRVVELRAGRVARSRPAAALLTPEAGHAPPVAVRIPAAP